jgi:hypothetical protein
MERMKHIQESIIGRKEVRIPQSIYQLEITYNNFYKRQFPAICLNEKEYDRYLADIMTLPGLNTAQKYLKSVHDEGGDVIIWANKKKHFSLAIRFFLQSAKLMYGVDHIRNLPIKSIPQSGLHPEQDYNTFKITKRIGSVDLSDYENMYDCFVENNLIRLV